MGGGCNGVGPLQLPPCLCLHVGRVEWAGGGLSKRAEHVAFPETLSMAPYASQVSNKVTPLSTERNRSRKMYRSLTRDTRARSWSWCP